MGIDNIKHYHHISDQFASSGQPQAEQFDAIARAGYLVVINLAMPDSSNAVAEEEAIVNGLQMVYVNIPVPFDAPEMHHLQAFFDAIRQHRDEKYGCIVH